MTFAETVDAVGRAVEIAGIGVIVVGALVAAVAFLLEVVRGGAGTEGYRGFREVLGRAILLGLEFLVAADIIRTVTTAPTFRNVGVLAVIVLIRTFLSWSLELEITGHWPWQAGRWADRPGRAADAGDGGDAGRPAS